jgi:hypothetical protein
VLPGICSRGNIPVTDGRELNVTSDKICAEFFKGSLKKELIN